MWPRELGDVVDGVPREVQRDGAGGARQAVHLGGVVDALEGRARAAGLREDAEARAGVAVAPGGRLDHERAQRASAASDVDAALAAAAPSAHRARSRLRPFVGMRASSRAGISRRSRRRPRRRAARRSRAAPRRRRPCACRRGSPSSPAARACTSTLPSAVASTGPASTRRPSTSAVIWQSTALRAPAADHVDRLDAPAGRPARAARARAGTCRRARRGCCARARRSRPARVWPARTQASAMRARHVAGAQQLLVVRVEERHVVARGLGQAQQVLVLARARGRERAAALLQQPEAHDVAQQARRAVDAALVREVEAPARRRRAPARRARGRAATTCRSRAPRSCGRAAARRRTPRRCRGPRPRTRGTSPRPWCGSSEPTIGARLDELAEDARRQPEALDQAVGPAPAARVEEAGRGRGRRLVGDRAAEPARDQVGHERDARGAPRGSRRPPPRAAGRRC